jgi:hypothetical protein
MELKNISVLNNEEDQTKVVLFWEQLIMCLWVILISLPQQ